MIISLNEAYKINPDITIQDIKSLELMMINHTNNHFHRPNYSPKILGATNNKLTVESPNLFIEGDLAEIVGTKYADGFYYVQRVDDDIVELESDRPLLLTNQDKNPRLFQVLFPEELKTGARDILEYVVKEKPKSGIRSESIGRMTLTYDTADDGTINGLPPKYFDFLLPFVKMR